MRPQSSTPYLVIVHYKGDGTTGQKIEFIPQEWPRFIKIFKTPDTEFEYVVAYEKICGMGWDAFGYRYTPNGPQSDSAAIVEEGAGYFIVSDNGNDWHFNKTNVKYTAMILI